MVSAIYNCVKEYENRLIDEKAFLISLSVGVPIDDFYEVDERLTYRGLVNGYVADCEKYLSIIDKYDEKTILEASIYMFNLIRRGVHGKLNEKASKLLSELGIFHG
jgi:CRISPR/Cas system CSM-associated protein Csm4 (group 5 of RAMP superfamily)